MLSVYEKYQLNWMVNHGFTLDCLITRLGDYLPPEDELSDEDWNDPSLLVNLFITSFEIAYPKIFDKSFDILGWGEEYEFLLINGYSLSDFIEKVACAADGLPKVGTVKNSTLLKHAYHHFTDIGFQCEDSGSVFEYIIWNSEEEFYKELNGYVLDVLRFAEK